jgi:hypothetical protein
LACLACSADHVVHGPDAGPTGGPDSGPSEDDAAVPDAGSADAGVDAPPRADCFTEDLLVATANSRFAVDTMVPVEDGWLVGVLSTSTGSSFVRVDREGRSSSLPPFSFGSDRVLPMGDSFARVSYGGVARIDRNGDELSSDYTPWRVAWGSVLGASVDPSGTLRVVSYDPEVYVSDLRIHVTEFTLDDREPTGFEVRDGTLPFAFTERLGPRFHYNRYFVRGDSLRVVGPIYEDYEDYQSVLVTLDTSAIGTGEPLGFRIDEEARWTELPFLFHFVGVTNDWDRMLAIRRLPESDVFEARVEPLPGHTSSSGAPTGSLGDGTPIALETVIAIADEREVRLVDAVDLSPRGAVTFEGTFEQVAQSGDAVAVLFRHTLAGELALSLRCVAIAP